MAQAFYAQDEAGNRNRVWQSQRGEPLPGKNPLHVQGGGFVYQLDDGTPLRRVDSDTFQIIGTGAYIHVVREA